MKKSRSLLIVNQSSELYGSDRSLLDFIKGLDLSLYNVVVCLPDAGPLWDELLQLDVKTVLAPIGKITRNAFTPVGFFLLLQSIAKAFKVYSSLNREYKFDLVYSNTLAILAPAFWAKFKGVPHIWHVREIINKPILVAKALCCIAQSFSKGVIFNSKETNDWFIRSLIPANNNSVSKHSVIWNGVKKQEIFPLKEKDNLRSQLGFDANDIIILMVGRINAWKGQDLLIKSCEQLAEEKKIDFSNVKVIFLGSAPPGQEHYLDSFKDEILKSPIANSFVHCGFLSDISNYYRIADISVVPSKEPEPFGRVAIEAMAFNIPVIAAAHGGLTEIIEDNISGLLMTPNDIDSLSNKLHSLINDEKLRTKIGTAGRLRQHSYFSLDSYCSNLEEYIAKSIGN